MPKQIGIIDPLRVPSWVPHLVAINSIHSFSFHDPVNNQASRMHVYIQLCSSHIENDRLRDRILERILIPSHLRASLI